MEPASRRPGTWTLALALAALMCAVTRAAAVGELEEPSVRHAFALDMYMQRMEYQRQLEKLTEEASGHRASSEGTPAGLIDIAPASPRFTLWHKLTFPEPVGVEKRSFCPASGELRAVLSQSFTYRWKESKWVVDQIYQWHDSHCYMLVLVAPYVQTAMEADISAALAKPNPVDHYCALFSDGLCDNIRFKFGNAAIESVTLNKTNPERWPGDPDCQPGVFTQKLDHFDPSETRTFEQSYYVCKQFWPADAAVQKAEGKILFYQGAETPLGGEPQQPMIWEGAARQRLLVMSLEHRYYGESFPFRPKPESADIPVEQLKWLTVEQVVEDAAYFLKTMRAQLSVPEAVPVITFGGSYGGALAAWLRAAKPDVFAAGISSSGPVNFIVGTPQWSKNSDLFHEVVSAAARAGGASCPSTIRAGLNEIERLGKSKAGRAELGERLKLCGRRDAVVNKVSAMELSDHFYTRVFGEIAQYDNVPFLYGSLATACKVATKAAEAAPSDALAPLLALTKWAGNLLYKSSDGSGDCWYWDIDSSDGSLIVDVRGYGLRYLDYSIYLYQSCTQGTPVTSLMSRKADADDMYTSKRVAKSAIKRDCLKIYDKSVATIKPAPFMAKGPKLLRRVGGVVFTNGEFDPWAGGSPRSLADLKPDAKAEAGFEYVSYPGVSHVHDLIWYDPFDAPANKGLRQKALDAAATFAEAWRQARL